MYVCPLCNGFKNIESKCPSCSSLLEDAGKVVDYYGDYSPYIEDDEAKLIDGIRFSSKEHLCLHLLYCPNCQSEQQILIKEQVY